MYHTTSRCQYCTSSIILLDDPFCYCFNIIILIKESWLIFYMFNTMMRIQIILLWKRSYRRIYICAFVLHNFNLSIYSLIDVRETSYSY